MLANKFFVAVATLVLFSCRVYAGGDLWFFSAEEITNAYRYQQQFGERLRQPLKPTDCMYGRKEFSASFQGKEFSAPCRFIVETTRQLREILESGAAKFLFALDADHAHLGIPKDMWERKYSTLSSEEMLPVLLQETALVAVYHTAEHLEPNSGEKHPGTTIWGKERSVLGHYDGRPNEILPALSDGSLAYEPEGYHWVNGFTFLAQRLGELQLVANGSLVVFDISFDDDLAAELPGTAINVSIITR